MICVSLRFLAGRYHATPWGSHVNEGAVEWPPSPFRIARALSAVLYRHPSPPDLDRCRSLLVRLATTPPRYALPAVSSGHTRHYMPIPGNTTKVIDAFLALDRDAEVVVGWDLALDPDDEAALDTLLEGLGYLGRAESWVEGTRCPQPATWQAEPAESGGEEGMVTVLAPAEHLAAWREGFLAGRPKGRKGPKVPETPWDVLTVETSWLQSGGWSAIPGLRQVRYAIRTSTLRPRRVERATAPPDLAWFRLASAVLPQEDHTTWLADRVRQALMSRAGDASAVFSGHDEAPAGHRHAWFLPSDEDGDGRIDHVAVYAPGGFGDLERRALAQLETLNVPWWHEGHEIVTHLVALGRRDDAVGPAWMHATSARWKSATPFVCARHPKRRANGWKDGVADQAALSWARLVEHRAGWGGDVAPVPVEVSIDAPKRGERERWHAFRTDRPNKGPLGVNRHVFRLELRFAAPVAGPISLGAGTHFGLGRFRPAS